MTTEPTGEITTLRRENSMMRQQLLAAGKRNENLTATLRDARDELARVRGEVAADRKSVV